MLPRLAVPVRPRDPQTETVSVRVSRRRRQQRRHVHTALCARCGLEREVNERRYTPLCSDCRTVVRRTATPTAGDGLGRGEWVLQGLTLVWKPAQRATRRRCRDCGQPTVDQHRATERCRDCWKAAVRAAAEERGAQLLAEKAARAAARAAANERQRHASSVKCGDCGAALTTRHRHVQRCRDCWKAAVRAAAEDRAAARGRTPLADSPTFCEIDGCLLAYPGETCPACLAAAERSATTEAA